MLEAIVDALRGAKEAALIAHVSPDGDTLGSALALRLALGQLGIGSSVYCQDEVPELYRILPGWECVRMPEAGEACAVAVAVDVSDPQRLGSCHALFFSARERLVLDHHGTNPGFGTVDCIREHASTAQVALEVIDRLGARLTPDIALCLYVAVSTDTGNFNYANTDGAALRAAARLVEAGVDVAWVTRKLYRERSCAKTRLIAAALSRLTLEEEGRLAVMALRPEDYRACGAAEADTEGLINYAIECQGVELAMLARQGEDGVKFSFRSVEPVDASAMASALGGGGHRLASGATVQGSMEEALRAAREAARRALGL